MYGLLGSDIWPRNNYLKIWNMRMRKKECVALHTNKILKQVAIILNMQIN